MTDDIRVDGEMEIWERALLGLRPGRSLNLPAQVAKNALRASLLGVQPTPVRLRHFELKRVLGRGETGVVFEALDTRTGVRCALKLLRVCSGDQLQRLKREFRALAGLAHPNLVIPHRLFLDREHGFFTMELLAGESFLSYVRCGAHADPVRLKAAVAQLASGVRALHAAGRVHRDLKPSNVRVTELGRVVIVDLGLASIARSAKRDTAAAGTDPRTRSNFCGTPGYMAPEQWSTQGAIGPAADWYAVGAILHRAIFGVLPKRVSPRARATGAPCTSRAKESGLDDLAGLCLQLLATDPAVRLDAATRLTGARHRRPTPRARSNSSLVGRHAELVRLNEALMRARGGKAVFALVVGPAGVGKTALLEQFSARLHAGERLLVSHCRQNETIPYEALDGAVDAWIALRTGPARSRPILDDDAAIAALHLFPALEQVAGLLPRTKTPRTVADLASLRSAAVRALRSLLIGCPGEPLTVWVVDDLHWGDRDSADLLRHLVAPPDTPRVLIVASARSGDSTLGNFLEKLYSDLERGASGFEHLEIELGPLLPADAERLVRSMLDVAPESLRAAERADSSLATRVAEASQGLPFLAHLQLDGAEALASSGVVPSIRAALERRVAHLSPIAERILLAAAAADHTLSLGMVFEMVGQPSADDDQDLHSAVATLMALKLLRTDPCGRLRVYDNRIREHVVGAVYAVRSRRTGSAPPL